MIEEKVDCVVPFSKEIFHFQCRPIGDTDVFRVVNMTKGIAYDLPDDGTDWSSLWNGGKVLRRMREMKLRGYAIELNWRNCQNKQKENTP